MNFVDEAYSRGVMFTLHECGKLRMEGAKLPNLEEYQKFDLNALGASVFSSVVKCGPVVPECTHTQVLLLLFSHQLLEINSFC